VGGPGGPTRRTELLQHRTPHGLRRVLGGGRQGAYEHARARAHNHTVQVCASCTRAHNAQNRRDRGRPQITAQHFYQRQTRGRPKATAKYFEQCKTSGRSKAIALYFTQYMGTGRPKLTALNFQSVNSGRPKARALLLLGAQQGGRSNARALHFHRCPPGGARRPYTALHIQSATKYAHAGVRTRWLKG